MTMRRRPCLLSGLLLAATAAGTVTRADPMPPLDRLVERACTASVVLLGEDGGHGAGRTVELKAQVVQRLVRDCGFTAVVFESQVYDFVDLEADLAAGTATRDQLVDAIGGMWSGSAHVQALAGDLFEAAATGQVRLFGMDPQTGGASQRFTQHELPQRLGGLLQGARASACALEIERLTRWLYGPAAPWGPQAIARLRACAADSAAAAARADPGRAGDDAVMADNFVQAVALLDAAEPVALRGRAMHANVRRVLATVGDAAKVVVWTATVHAARNLSDARRDRGRLGALLAAELGDRVMTVGFSALTGRHGRAPAIRTLTPAPAESLEARAFADAKAPAVDLVYLDHDALVALGVAPARALDYGDFQLRPWGTVMDGLLVLREERPMASDPAILPPP